MYLIICTIRKESFVGLLNENETSVFNKWFSQNNQSEELLSKINILLKSSKTDIKNIKGIIVINGPGSYTGIRVGVVTANTLSFSLNVPVVGINILEICAYYYFSLNNNKSIIVATSSIHDKYYFALYERNGKKITMKNIGNKSPEEIIKTGTARLIFENVGLSILVHPLKVIFKHRQVCILVI